VHCCLFVDDNDDGIFSSGLRSLLLLFFCDCLIHPSIHGVWVSVLCLWVALCALMCLTVSRAVVSSLTSSSSSSSSSALRYAFIGADGTDDVSKLNGQTVEPASSSVPGEYPPFFFTLLH
jgi:hypothetical protein